MYNIDQCKSANTPISATLSLNQDINGKSVDQTSYRGIIGSLLYLTSSRPDIMFSVCLCACFQANLKESHLTAVKRIFSYLHRTKYFGLWYPSIVILVWLVIRIIRDIKGISGSCQFLGSSLISRHSKTQNSVASSTAEAQYIAIGECLSQIL